MPTIDSLISLQDPLGNELDVRSVTVEETVNGGWSWSAELGSAPPLDEYLEDATYTLELGASGDTKVLPPLVAQGYTENVTGRGGTIHGIDLVMYRLTRSTHVLPQSRNTTSEDIIDYIAAQLAMTGLVTGHDVWSFPILEFEETGRTNMLVHIQRLMDVAGYEFRVVRNGLGQGVLEFYPLEFAPTGPPPALQPAWTRVTRPREFTERATQMVYTKTSRMSDARSIPPRAAGNVVTLGGNAFHSAQSTFPGVTFWDGDPTAGGIQRGGNGVSYADGSITHVRAETDTPDFVVQGTEAVHVPPGVDLSFSYPHDSGISPPRPADEPWEETLFPSEAYVAARAELYLWRANRNTHNLEWEGPPCLATWFGLGYVLTWPGRPDSRVESITHALGGGQASTKVRSATLGSSQW